MNNETNHEESNRPYNSEIEENMKIFYNSLSEKDRHRFAGLEAMKIGHGGRSYIAEVLGCSRRTASKGACEFSNLPKKEVDSRIRNKGGGRKPYQNKWREIDEKFLVVLHKYIYMMEF